MKIFIHPNTPPKLVQRFKNADCKYHRLAKAQGVNVAHVYNLIHDGIEPKKGDIRVKLFLSRNPRRARPRKPQTPMQKAIQKMAKNTRTAINDKFQPIGKKTSSST